MSVFFSRKHIYRHRTDVVDLIIMGFIFKIPLHQGKAAFEETTGIAIKVWSKKRDFAAVGFIVDQIDALISEWYPGKD